MRIIATFILTFMCLGANAQENTTLSLTLLDQADSSIIENVYVTLYKDSSVVLTKLINKQKKIQGLTLECDSIKISSIRYHDYLLKDIKSLTQNKHTIYLTTRMFTLPMTKILLIKRNKFICIIPRFFHASRLTTTIKTERLPYSFDLINLNLTLSTLAGVNLIGTGVNSPIE